jgi:hypothetical protein
LDDELEQSTRVKEDLFLFLLLINELNHPAARPEHFGCGNSSLDDDSLVAFAFGGILEYYLLLSKAAF